MDKHFIELKTHHLGHYAQITKEKLAHPKVTLDSSALLAITDLRHHDAITIDQSHTIQQAHNLMIARAVRLLFVMSHDHFVGLITANDILGEKPVALHKRHTEILISEIMQEKTSLRVIEYNDLVDASVGDLMATMKKIGSQHALIVRSNKDSKTGEDVVGLVSTSQIANLIGQAFTTFKLPTMSDIF